MPRRSDRIPATPTWEETLHQLTEGSERAIPGAEIAHRGYRYVESYSVEKAVLFVVDNRDIGNLHERIMAEEQEAHTFSRVGWSIIPFGDDRAAFFIEADMGVGHSWPAILEELLAWAAAVQDIEIEIRWPIYLDGARRY